MVQYAQKELLASLCSAQNENLGTLLVEVVASVLDNEVRNKQRTHHLYMRYIYR